MHSDVLPQSADSCAAETPRDDCIAICSPGAVLTVLLLVERITITPRPNPNSPGEVSLCSDELYDVLIRPENCDIQRLLFVSPHVLFDLGLTDATNTLGQYVFTEDMSGKLSASWHYPEPPVETNANVKVTLRLLSDKPDTSTVHTYMGSVAKGHVEMPSYIQAPNVLGFLQGCGKSIFEYVFDKPVTRGEHKWLRLHIKPPRLNAPGDVQLWKEGCKCSPKAEYFQLLHILGADTMLASFKDELSNLSEPTWVSSPRATKVPQSIQDIAGTVLKQVFQDGFEKPGTYTRIEDQRLFLLPQDCRVYVKHNEGSVRFIGYPKIDIVGKTSNCLCWSAGLRDFAAYDPIAVALLVNEYIRSYATTRVNAKSKADIVVATGVDYELGCHVIDELEAINVLQSFNDGYHCGEKDLPAEAMERWTLLVELSQRIACRLTLTKAHFRILFETQWRQETGA